MEVGCRPAKLPLKDSKNVIVCKSMFPSIPGLKSDGMITEMVRAERQSYDSAKAPIEHCSGRHPPFNKSDAEVICLLIHSYNPTISHYKLKNSPCKQYLNPELSIKEMYKKFQKTKKTIKFVIKPKVMF